MPDGSAEHNPGATAIKGIIPALVTPFHPDESLDLAGLETMVNWVVDGGVHGIFVVGSQGEFYALSRQEHEAVVQTSVSAAAGRVPTYAGASAITTRDAVFLAQQAEAAGASAVTILPPPFLRLTESELERHFESIADSVGIPVILYNQPQRTGVSLSAPFVARLASVANIVAIKDSSASLNQTLDYVAGCPEHFRVLIGNDSQIAFGLIGGVAGAIASTANVVPGLCVAIHDAVAEGDIARAVRLQLQLRELRAAFELGSFPVVVKEALSLLGLPAGPCRRPVAPLERGARARLRDVLIGLRVMTAEGGYQ